MLSRAVTSKILRRRRSVFVLLLLFLSLLFQGYAVVNDDDFIQKDVLSSSDAITENATVALRSLQTKGRAPKTDYSRSQYGSGWAQIGDCDTRNLILQRDLEDVELGSDGCTVLNGTLNDPYTGRVIYFVRGGDTSSEVQIDHVVALSDAWQKGAQYLGANSRLLFANDSLNLLAVDGPANQKKGDSDAASWLPPNKNYRCRYVARQIAVKQKYTIWVTPAEKATMSRVLNSCKTQPLPVEEIQ